MIIPRLPFLTVTSRFRKANAHFREPAIFHCTGCRAHGSVQSHVVAVSSAFCDRLGRDCYFVCRLECADSDHKYRDEFSFSNDRSWYFKWTIHRGRQNGLSKVQIHVTDFHGYLGSGITDATGNSSWAGRLTLNADNWEIVLDALPDSGKRREYASRNGGCAITHVGQISRRDGATFSATDVQSVLETLRLFLTFSRGHSVGADTCRWL